MEKMTTKIEREWQADVHKRVADFKREISAEDPDWVKSCRLRYLAGCVDILGQGLAAADRRYNLWTERDIDYASKTIMLDLWRVPEGRKLLDRLKKQVFFLSSGKENDDQITPEQIEQAKEYPIGLLLPAGRNRMVNCPFHDDQHPSMGFKWNKYRCFACGASGDTIDLAMKICGLDFIQAVKFLNGRV